MPILGGIRGSDNTHSNNMGTPYVSFHEFKKQASFFFKEKIKTARLALTDVTPAELLTEEATSGNPWAPDTRTLGLISRAAFEVDDFWRIVEILHKRLAKFEKKDWRVSYNSLVLLEHLLTHGPGSTADEFQVDIDVIREMESFQYIDERGFNWGLALRKKCAKILQLLEDGPLLKEERDRARKLTREIKGFGSFSGRPSSHQMILKESSSGVHGMRCNSDFSGQGNLQHQNSSSSGQDSTEGGMKALVSLRNVQVLESLETETKENMVPNTVVLDRRLDEWNSSLDNLPLLDDRKDDTAVGISDVLVDHPFKHTEKESTASLLATTD